VRLTLYPSFTRPARLQALDQSIEIERLGAGRDGDWAAISFSFGLRIRLLPLLPNSEYPGIVQICRIGNAKQLDVVRQHYAIKPEKWIVRGITDRKIRTYTQRERECVCVTHIHVVQRQVG